MPKLVAINDLKPGMVIVQIRAQNGPVKIRKAGLVNSYAMIQGLAEMGVLEVEIDPAQTVEIDLPDLHTSQTQQLLRSDENRVKNGAYRHSEQLNRSLFLPSVQELPSLWQYYARRVGTAFVIVVGGFGLGWSVATFSLWMPLLLPVNPPGSSIALPANQAPVSATKPESIALPKYETEATEQGVEQEQLESPVLVAKPQQGPVSQIKQGIEQITQSQQLNQQDTDLPVSPELLKKFRDAVAQLDEKSESNYAEQKVSPSEVIGISKLPAWVLTELPAMAFSAHMYVGNPADRWVRVNGKQLAEGDYVDDGLQIVRIEPQYVVLNYRGQEFSMPALTDW
jgi:general secretion pathway protein B